MATQHAARIRAYRNAMRAAAKALHPDLMRGYRTLCKGLDTALESGILDTLPASVVAKRLLADLRRALDDAEARIVAADAEFYPVTD
jgi:outer membrane protein TolC